MRNISRSARLGVIPLAVSTALVLAACGSGGDTDTAAQSAPATADAPTAPETAEAPAATADKAVKAHAKDTSGTAAAGVAPKTSDAAKSAKTATTKQAKATKDSGTAKKAGNAPAAVEAKGISSIDTEEEAAESARVADAKSGSTDVGVTKDQIKLGTVTMHGMALGNVLAAPLVRGIQATLTQINDRGGILGRRIHLVDCDDGPGEVSRTKACIKKLASQDKVFSLLSISSWGSASVHDDLKGYQLPAIGTWAYSQTEWQDPYMFPTHMSMIHEAMAGAQWVRNVVKPKTYGLMCLTSPEMQLACSEVQKVMDASGSKLVKKADVSISETSMSSQVLSLRAANPEHIIHYVINPATMAKFMVEAAQQNYYPAKGISGNHLATEVLGSLFGKHPLNRYWTNTTYKLWGPEFMATMNKYARANRGINHHIVQASYVGASAFERAAKAVGPNLTRQRLMAQLSNGDVYAADASLDQRFSWANSERNGTNWNKNYGQGREFMYKYTSTNTASNPDGSPNGFAADPDQPVIYTWK